MTRKLRYKRMINPEEILPLNPPSTRNACQVWVDRLRAEMATTAALRCEMVELLAECIYLRSCHDKGYSYAKWSANESKDVWREYAASALGEVNL